MYIDITGSCSFTSVYETLVGSGAGAAPEDLSVSSAYSYVDRPLLYTWMHT